MDLSITGTNKHYLYLLVIGFSQFYNFVLSDIYSILLSILYCVLFILCTKNSSNLIFKTFQGIFAYKKFYKSLASIIFDIFNLAAALVTTDY